MAAPTIASVVAQMSNLVNSWRTYTTQLRNWLGGTVDGGPGSDGSYPLSDDMGVTYLIPSPAAQAARVDGVVNSAQVYATAASGSASAAGTSEMNAATSESTAETHRDDAQDSANLAGVYATNAGNSAAAALSSRTTSDHNSTAAVNAAAAALVSETNAGTSETNAGTSEAAASGSASEASVSAQVAQGYASQAQAVVTGSIHFVDPWDASGNTYPPSPGLNDLYKISVAGTLGGVSVRPGDSILWTNSGWITYGTEESVWTVAGETGNVTVSVLQSALNLGSAAYQPTTAFAAPLGYTPVQQGTGVGQTTNAVKIGWNGSSLLLQVDTTPLGAFAMQSWVTDSYMPRTGGAFTGQLTTQGAPTSGGIATAPAVAGQLVVVNTGGGAAYMTFWRSGGGYAAYFGLDSDNQWKVGGWSMGANAYVVHHDGNCARTFVQAGDPGGAAADGDLWVW